MWMTKKPTDKLNLCQGVASSKWTMGNQEENFLTQKLNFIKYSHEIPSIFPGSRRGRRPFNSPAAPLTRKQALTQIGILYTLIKIILLFLRTVDVTDDGEEAVRLWRVRRDARRPQGNRVRHRPPLLERRRQVRMYNGNRL